MEGSEAMGGAGWKPIENKDRGGGGTKEAERGDYDKEKGRKIIELQ